MVQPSDPARAPESHGDVPLAGSAEADAGAGENLDVLQALLTLLPAALLFAGVLHGVPTHTSAGAGWILLASLPALAVALVRSRPDGFRGMLLFAVVLYLTLSTWVVIPHLMDTFEARRARVTWTAWLALLLSGATLGPAGRRTLARGMVALGLAGVVTAWIDTALDPVRAFAGTLENSGDLSETVLPGALIGYAALSGERGRWRALGVACAAAYLFTVGRVPVLAGGLSFLTAIGLAALMGRALDRRFLAPAALAIAAGLAIGRTMQAADVDPDAAAAPETEVSGEAAPGDVPGSSASFGGVAFRRLTWPRVARMAMEGGPAGAGAGQFARDFPPYRDPREIELSSHGRRSPTSTEVEHAHNDWLQAFAEYGLVGGLAWLAFGLTALWRALVVLTSRSGSDPTTQAIAVAGLGALANATFNSPFFEGPAFACAAPLLGCLLALPYRPSHGSWLPERLGLRLPWERWFAERLPAWLPRDAKLVRAGALLLAAAQAPAATDLVRHGAALAPLARTISTTVADGKVVHRVEAKRRAVERALAACPDSTIARVERGHLLRVESAPVEEQLALWQRVLTSRPHHFEALLSAANLCARVERFDEAHALYERAAALDPANPTLIRNRLLLALRAGDVEAVLARLADEAARDALDEAWLERSAAELLLSGRPHLGLPLLERARPELRIGSAEQAYALSKEVDVELLADALLAHAHFTWAREHALAGDPASATRSYRQSLAVADRYPDLVGGARRVRLELAAALSLRGQPDEAAALAGGLEPTAVDVAELPAWARDELAAHGWIAP